MPETGNVSSATSCPDCSHVDERHTAGSLPGWRSGCMECGCRKRPPFDQSPKRGTAALYDAIRRVRGEDPPSDIEGYA